MPLLSSGSSVGVFTLTRHVITSAMSEVYEGRDPRTGACVAVKILSPELYSEPQWVARFLNEGRMLRRVTHEHIVRVLDLGELPRGIPYVVLEWMPSNLQQALERGGPVSLHVALRLGRQLAAALAALHEMGFVHRDLKPANVLLAGEDGASWQVKLADLGLAKLLPDPTETASGFQVSTADDTSLGTSEYMAPEQWIDAKNADARADVYALGILLFQMLTGQLPFVSQEQQHLMRLHLFEPPPLDRLEGRAPTDVREFIARMLAKRPPQRPALSELMTSHLFAR